MTIAFVLNGARTPCARGVLAAAVCLGLAAIAPSAMALDPGEDGVQTSVHVSGIGDIARAIVVDPDGNIVLAGSNGGADSVLVRLTPSGALDSLNFGSGGIAINDLSPSRGDELLALVGLNGGGYLACGKFNSVATGFDFVVARFDSKGALDPAFNNVGYVVTPFAATSAPDQCNAITVQTDGMIVAAGTTTVGGHPHVAVARYTTGGVLDSNFGTGGLVDINAAASASGDSEAHALVLQPDGKLLLAGYATGSGNYDLLVMRLKAADGSPDSNFGTGGITRTPVGTSEDIANAMVLQPDGRIVLAGSTYAGGHRDFVLARYTSAGVLDPSFDGDGLVTTAVGPSDDYAYALTLMPWGRLVAAGSARINTSNAETDLAVVAYNADGSLDRFFGIGGKRMVDVSTLQNVVYGLATDLGGANFWAGGTAAPNGVDQDFLAIEFGLPDTIFRHDFETATAP